jgi:hypothetical protein
MELFMGKCNPETQIVMIAVETLMSLYEAAKIPPNDDIPMIVSRLAVLVRSEDPDMLSSLDAFIGAIIELYGELLGAVMRFD